jgi:sirohydrochlorin ferrochelatase
MASIRAAVTSSETATSAFIIATDLDPHHPAWRLAEIQLDDVAASLAPILGFRPELRLAPIDHSMTEGIEGAREVFVLPVALDLNLLDRECMGGILAEARRRHPDISIHHDDVDPGDSLLVDCFADQVSKALGAMPPQRAGLILAPSGHGDAASRAQSYRLMRLIWERLGLAAAETGFLRHTQPFLLSTFEKCAQSPLQWIVLPQAQWRTEHPQYAETILENFQRAVPQAATWRMADPPGAHPAMTAWIAQRILRLWREKRARELVRVPSAKSEPPEKPRSWNVGAGVIAAIPDQRAMADLLARVLPGAKPERVLVKVTWHGYATGTYTDPAALDFFLAALPAKAVILEGHTSSRNLGGAEFDWENQARENRAWIRREEGEYLRRTGLHDVLIRHQAQYVNITDAYWDAECVSHRHVNQILAEQGVALHHPEIAQFVPQVLLDYRGCPLISFAKFKGPTRLGISNLFGLLPPPLRSAWHGPNITYFARVCCDIAKMYGALFALCGVNEALHTAVRWNRQGLYRSRWGNYDLIPSPGYVAAGLSLVTADILASRLQGQDVSRSAFFDVVRAELGWDEEAAEGSIPQSVQRLFA